MWIFVIVPLPTALLILWWCWCRRLQLEGRPLRPKGRVFRRITWDSVWWWAQNGLPGTCRKADDPEAVETSGPKG